MIARPPTRGGATALAPDAVLFAAVAAGDQDALYELFCRHSPDVHAVARLACGSACAEQVTRDVFLAIWDDQSRRERTSASPPTTRLDLLTRAAAEGAAKSAEGEDQPRLPGAFDALPTPVAEVLALLVFGGCSFLETAAVLDVAEPVVRQRATVGFTALAVTARADDLSGDAAQGRSD